MTRFKVMVGSALISAACLLVPVRGDAKPCSQHHHGQCGGGGCPKGETCHSGHKGCYCKPTKHHHQTGTSATAPKSAPPAQ